MMDDKRVPAVGEDFEWHGVKLITVECDGKGCTNCYFNRKMNKVKSDGCIKHACESGRRLDCKNVKFRKVK